MWDETRVPKPKNPRVHRKNMQRPELRFKPRTFWLCWCSATTVSMLKYSMTRFYVDWKYWSTESGCLLGRLGLKSTLLLSTVVRQWSCVRVPAEGDKGVTGSSEVSLVISQWQPCLHRGLFNQTLAELASDPAGLSGQLLSADSGSASKDLHNVWGVAFINEASTLEVQESARPSQSFSANLALVLDHVTTSIDWKQG